jgi:hypothetical protein
LKAIQVSDFMQQAVKACCEGSLKQPGIKALLHWKNQLFIFTGRKATTLLPELG